MKPYYVFKAKIRLTPNDQNAVITPSGSVVQFDSLDGAAKHAAEEKEKHEYIAVCETNLSRPLYFFNFGQEFHYDDKSGLNKRVLQP